MIYPETAVYGYSDGWAVLYRELRAGTGRKFRFNENDKYNILKKESENGLTLAGRRDILSRTKGCFPPGRFCVDFVSPVQWRYGVGAYFLQGISAGVFRKIFRKRNSKGKQEE